MPKQQCSPQLLMNGVVQGVITTRRWDPWLLGRNSDLGGKEGPEVDVQCLVFFKGFVLYRMASGTPEHPGCCADVYERILDRSDFTEQQNVKCQPLSIFRVRSLHF